MPELVRFEAPYRVAVAPEVIRSVQAGEVRVRTLLSGVSAGTELTAYRGTNPYVTSSWDPELRLFEPRPPAEPGYPLEGWGYSEVGRVVEVAQDVDDVRVGDVVWGIWGHRSEACLAAEAVRDHVLPPGTAPEVGCFARVGSVALNAVLAARCGLGSTVVVMGQGVIGLLATAFAVRSGAQVLAVDGMEMRRHAALELGAAEALAPAHDVAAHVREATAGRGADAVIDLSGSYNALHEATRIAGVDAVVVAAGFYQGAGAGLRLGEEFHHNRITLVSSQIGSVPAHLATRWTRERLTQAVMSELVAGRPDVLPLITHRFPPSDVAAAFELLDRSPATALQVLLDYAR